MPAILFTTLLTLSVLYLPQPLLPVLSQEFGVSREAAALLTTVSFLPLSLAPLFYGMVLETFSAKRLLRYAVALLAASVALVFFCDSFACLMMLRLLQGLIIPAMLTALMTFTSRLAGKGEIAKAMAWYVSATILGGFAGRFISGLIASLLSWRFSFLLLGASLVCAWFWLGRLPASGQVRMQKPKARLIREILGIRAMRNSLGMVFCFFFAFAAMMNYLPFRLTELSPEADEFRIGAAYLGYLFGIVMSLSAVSLQRRFGGARKVMLGALAVFGLSLVLMTMPAVAVLIAGMFFLCGANFLTHSTAAGYLNRQAGDRQAMVNGLYVSFYYGGGALGSFLPGYLYRGLGWGGFMVALLMVIGGAIAFAFRLPQAD